MALGIFYKCAENCANLLKPLRSNGFPFDGLITPTSNLDPTKLQTANYCAAIVCSFHFFKFLTLFF